MRVLDHLLDNAGLLPATAEQVLRLLGAPGRHYHGLQHLSLLWSRHRHYARGSPFAAAEPSRLIACAIVFHDAIYEPMRSDNEPRSAALWRQMAPPDMCQDQVEWVSVTIEATANHLAVTDAGSERARLRLWMLDLDLTPLGDRPAVFARNTRQLRLEFAALADGEWECRRHRFLKQLAASPRIYRSPPLTAAFEQQARENIAGALQARH